MVAGAAILDELLNIYSLALTGAFKVAVGLLVFLALVALVLATSLPKLKLVEEEPAADSDPVDDFATR